MAWAGAYPVVTAPIFGVRNVEKLRDPLAALNIGRTPALRAEVATL